MTLHKEISFETDICRHLAGHDRFYAEGDAAGCVRLRIKRSDPFAYFYGAEPETPPPTPES